MLSQPRHVIATAIRSGQTPFSDYAEFEEAFRQRLSCDMDYARRLLSGSRLLRQKHSEEIKELLQLPEIDFAASPRDAAVRLGLSARHTEKLLRQVGGGIDFASRTSDAAAVKQLFDLLKGYWELVFWSFSRLDEQAISRELFIVDAITENNFISCRVNDVNFTYSGVIFPVLHHLYCIVEKDRLLDEVGVYLTNRPDRAPAVLRGITLGLSGGVDEIHSYPTAGKVAFRYLGKSAEQVARRYPDAPAADDQIEQYLAKKIPRYMSKEEVDGLAAGEASWLQISRLDNTIEPDAVPFALRAVD